MDKQIRIGMLTARFYPIQAGAEIQCARLCGALNRSGHTATVLTQKLPATSSFELIDSINVCRLGLPIPGMFGSFFYFIASARFILKRFNDFDILHAHIASTPALIASVFTKFLGKPSIVKFAGSRHSGDISTALRTPHGNLKLKFIMNNASAFVCPSSEIAQELENYGFNKNKTHVIPNGTDTELFMPADKDQKRSLKRKLGLDPEAKTAVYIGRLEKGKGVETLIEAWRSAVKQPAVASARLVILGSGSLEARLKAQSSGLAGIYFTGWKTNTAEYLKAADLFVLPSSGEGMPNSLIEAMSSGLACVSTDIGGIRELISHGQNGLLCAPGNPDSLANHIVKLFSDPDNSLKLGSAARQTVLDKYSIAKISSEYIELYRLLLKDTGTAKQ